jgi:hypothetical protein
MILFSRFLLWGSCGGKEAQSGVSQRGDRSNLLRSAPAGHSSDPPSPWRLTSMGKLTRIRVCSQEWIQLGGVAHCAIFAPAATFFRAFAGVAKRRSPK